MFDVLDIGASGLQAQRTRMDLIAENIANVNVTHNAQGKPIPYRRKFATLAAGMANGKPGVRVDNIQTDNSELPKRYDPGNPDANAEGFVAYPNVDIAVEVVNSMEASRAYEANVSMMEVTKAMLNSALRLIA
jgi:flagellar basal-body rod protein FlgC